MAAGKKSKEKRRRGRPLAKIDRKKSVAIRVACTEKEKLDTEDIADRIGASSVSQYCLDAILDANRRATRELESQASRVKLVEGYIQKETLR